MQKIGVTGGIGSGKSTVCRIFKNLGVPVFIADVEGKKILNSNEKAKKQVINIFGKDMYTATGEIDRKRMAQLVFNDPRELEKLNGIVHPLVSDRFEAWCEEHEHSPYVIKEAAILFESGAYHGLDKVINVFAPKEQRIGRIKKRDDTTKEEVLKRMRFQYSDEERNELSDLIIMNEDGKEEELLPQIMELHEILLNETRKW
ncbi:MAG: dephospho-CoA kinase [Vicingaceae bacterium]